MIIKKVNLVVKAFRILRRSIRDSFKSVFRNFSLSLASISCITITLIVVSISIVLSYNVTNFTDIIEKNVTMVVFIDMDVDEERIREMQDEIKNMDNVDAKSVKFIDKMSIADDMMDSSDVLKSVMEDYTRENSPLQDTFQLKVTDIEGIDEVAKKINKIDGVDLVKYGEEMVKKLIKAFDVIRQGCIYIVIALVLVTAFLIANTIKITIFSRRKEIEIMRLVGASNINIKIPFMFEGLLLGVLGSIIPIIITIVGYNDLYNHFGGVMFSQFIKLVKPEPFVFYISLTLLAIGMLVGMVGSIRTVKKYLKI